MSSQVALATESQPCVWMCAGLINYRLCSRGFDCEHCPLDAALRGESPDRSHCIALHNRAHTNSAVPSDRLYATGHTWIQPLSEEAGTWRLGVDAFAAAILGSAAEIAWDVSERVLESGEAVCTIDLGLGRLALGAPIRSRVIRGNEALHDQPACIVTDPYYDGWIVELSAAEPAPLGDLSAPRVARDQMQLDLRRFRRSVAFHLLAEVTTRNGRATIDEQLTDLRQVVAGAHYVELLRDFVH